MTASTGFITLDRAMAKVADRYAMTFTLVCNGEEVAKFDGSNWK